MNDRYDPNLILDYVEGQIDATRRARIESMLAVDASLRELVEQLQADRDALRSLPREVPVVELTEPAMGLLERRLLMGEEPVVAKVGPSGSSFVVHRWSRLLVVGSLAAVLMLSGGLLFLSTQGSPLLDRAKRLESARSSALPEGEAGPWGGADVALAVPAPAPVTAPATVPGASQPLMPGAPARERFMSRSDAAAADSAESALSDLLADATLDQDNRATPAVPMSANQPLFMDESPRASRPRSNHWPPALASGASPQLVIQSATPLLTRQAVLDWAATNAVAFADAPPPSAGAFNTDSAPALLLKRDGSDELGGASISAPARGFVSHSGVSEPLPFFAHEVAYILTTPDRLAALAEQLNQSPLQHQASVLALEGSADQPSPVLTLDADHFLLLRQERSIHQAATSGPSIDLDPRSQPRWLPVQIIALEPSMGRSPGLVDDGTLLGPTSP